MSPEEYPFDENLDMQVTTQDTTYWILSDDYYYANDTLYINILEPPNERTDVKVKMNIPKTEIEKVEVTKTDITGTWIVAGVVLVVAATIVIFLTNEKFEKMKKN